MDSDTLFLYSEDRRHSSVHLMLQSSRDESKTNFLRSTYGRRVSGDFSSRRDRDGDGDPSSRNEDLRRRSNILKAIEDRSTYRGSFTSMDHQRFDQIRDLSAKNLNLTRSSSDNNNEKSFSSFYKNYDKCIKKLSISPNDDSSTESYESKNFKQSSDHSIDNFFTTDDESLLGEQDEPARLLKIREGNIVVPSKMTAELRNIETPKNRRVSEDPPRDVTSLLTTIEVDSEVGIIKKSEIINPVPEKSYSGLKNLVTRISPTEDRSENDDGRENFYRDAKEPRYDEIFGDNDDDDPPSFLGTERVELGKIPIIESTKKLSPSDSARIKIPNQTRENSVSTSEISPIEQNADYTYGEVFEIREGGFFNDTIPYEVENFLEDALGDELFNGSNVTYATINNQDRTNSHFAASDLMSRAETPTELTFERTPRNFGTLDRSMGIYHSFSQRIKKKFRSGLRAKENVPPITAAPTLTPEVRESEKIRELLKVVSAEQTVINQATKALNVCKNMKEFANSSERIESERLLLLANLRKCLILDEIKRITSSKSKQEEIFDGQRGDITISEISLNLRESIKPNETEEEDEQVEWFVAIVSQGLRVWATRPTSHRTKDSKIYFPDAITITDLAPSFKIYIEIYSIKLEKSTYSHEDKYRIRKRKETTPLGLPCCSCFPLSPSTSTKYHHSHGPSDKNTRFVLSGFIDIFLQNLFSSSSRPLMLVPADSILQGTIDVNLACRLHLSVNHQGFVNHCDEARGFAIWNRRWCVLKGHTLMFWNYPDEQETKEPLKIIDLINCISGRINTADRTICAKPRTLLFETARRKSPSDRNTMIVECRTACTIVRNLMSLDSVRELVEWSTKLNHVIISLREWNIIHANKTGTMTTEV